MTALRSSAGRSRLARQAASAGPRSVPASLSSTLNCFTALGPGGPAFSLRRERACRLPGQECLFPACPCPGSGNAAAPGRWYAVPCSSVLGYGHAPLRMDFRGPACRRHLPRQAPRPADSREGLRLRESPACIVGALPCFIKSKAGIWSRRNCTPSAQEACRKSIPPAMEAAEPWRLPGPGAFRPESSRDGRKASLAACRLLRPLRPAPLRFSGLA